MPFMCTSSTRKGGGGKERPVKIITDNSVENIVFGNTEIFHPCNYTVSQRSVAYIYEVCGQQN